MQPAQLGRLFDGGALPKLSVFSGMEGRSALHERACPDGDVFRSARPAYKEKPSRTPRCMTHGPLGSHASHYVTVCYF